MTRGVNMDRIAIISDIHGNLKALEATLEDIRDRGIERIFCLGDIIAKGKHFNECIKLIRDNCEIVIKGNCDEYFTNEIVLDDKSEIEVKRIMWNRSNLSEDSISYLKGLPYCFEFYLSGRLVRLFHSHPNKINQFVGNIDTVDRLYELFLPSNNTISDNKADIVIYGHIHVPYVQKIYNRTIINVGSVGNSIDVYRDDDKDGDNRNTTVANYLIISGNYDSREYSKLAYELVSIPYDIDLELFDNEDNIELSSYQKELKEGRYRDGERIIKSILG